MSTDSLREARDAQPSFGVLKTILAAVDRAVNVERLLREADTLHTGRPSRSLHKNTLTVKGVWEAQSRDITARSRLVEIRVSVGVQRDVLHLAHKKCRLEFTARHAALLRTAASTAEQRKEALERLFMPVVLKVDELDGLIAQLDTYIKDIDQSAFGLRNATELLKLALGPRASEAIV